MEGGKDESVSADEGFHKKEFSQDKAGIDEILDLEKISRGNGPFFSISS